MAIRYVDYLSGNDTTGNGTAAAPYKTLVKAIIGLVGGDEVRVAKTYTRPGTPQYALTFYYEMAYATASGDLTAALPAGSVIGNEDIGYYVLEAGSFDGTFTTWWFGNGRTEYFPYPDQSVGVFKPAFVYTAAPASQQAVLETLSLTGWPTTANNRVTISGGWNLSNLTRDGETWLRSPNWKQGKYYSVSNNYWTISYLNLIGFYSGSRIPGSSANCSYIRTLCCFTGHDFYACYGATASHLDSYCDDYDWWYGSTSGTILSDSQSIASAGRPLYMSNAASNTFNNIKIHGPNAEGVLMENSHLNTFYDLDITDPGYQCLIMNASSGNRFYRTSLYLGPMQQMNHWPSDNLNVTYSINTYFEDLSMNDNDWGGGFAADRSTVVMRRPVINFNWAMFYAANSPGTEVKIYKRDNTANNHQVYAAEGFVETVTSPARNGIAWKMWPNAEAQSVSRPLRMAPFQIGVAANKPVTVTCHVYLESPCSARLFCRGLQLSGINSDVVSSTVTTAGSWVPMSITVTPTESGVLEVEVQAWGSGQGIETCTVDEVKVS